MKVPELSPEQVALLCFPVYDLVRQSTPGWLYRGLDMLYYVKIGNRAFGPILYRDVYKWHAANYAALSRAP